MPPATKAKYRRAARYYHSGMTQVESLMKAKVYTSLEAANANGHKLFKPDKGNAALLGELERLNKIEFDASVLSKKEKLEASATITRGIQDRIEEQLESDDGEVDHKLLDSYIKMGKRDDQLQGHSIMAETNPVDKRDALLADWLMELQDHNDKEREKKADIIDI